MSFGYLFVFTKKEPASVSYLVARLIQPPPMELILVISVAFPSVRIHFRTGSSPKTATGTKQALRERARKRSWAKIAVLDWKTEARWELYGMEKLLVEKVAARRRSGRDKRREEREGTAGVEVKTPMSTIIHPSASTKLFSPLSYWGCFTYSPL